MERTALRVGVAGAEAAAVAGAGAQGEARLAVHEIDFHARAALALEGEAAVLHLRAVRGCAALRLPAHCTATEGYSGCSHACMSSQ